MSDRRFAIYFVPAAGSGLYRFGAATIGYDCCSGADLPVPAGLGLSRQDWDALTREPRKYGFHATLKAPFRLRHGGDDVGLIDAFERFTAERTVAPCFVPQVRLIGGFVAVVPDGADPAIRELADACVTEFEPFRAPLSPDERRRRVASGLSDAQVTNLDRWGYPYVFEEFRFHMTLTGSLPLDRRADILSQLQARYAQMLGDAPIAVDQIALLHQDCATARFRVLRHTSIGTPNAGAA
jgi:putative phosphonate metabolism protein